MADSEQKYYLAVDIGASSGRHILGSIADGKIQMEEIHRFENGMKQVDGHKCWEIDRLFKEIVTGLKKCKELGKIPVSMAIDTWAVDYVLLNKSGEVLGKTYGYRDDRTQGMDEVVEKLISKEDLYQRTGIQKQIFNTIYQLVAMKEQEPEILAQAERLLLIPDYFNYKLTGEIRTEYTNATTTQLVSPRTKDWDKELMRLLGIPTKIFGGITMAGTTVGRLTEKIEREVGFNLDVVQAASHDTASAVVSVPAQEEDFLYISSGTWSLMGIEREEADYSEESRVHNFTNEGGYEYRYRYLKNIMGLWMQQSVKKEYESKYSYNELWDLAEKSGFHVTVDANDERLLAPESMIQTIKGLCEEKGEKIPEIPGEIVNVIALSLADCYKRTAEEIESLTGKKYPVLRIVGGGSQAGYLCQLTANATGKEVLAGPTEGTAIGNLLVQMIRDKRYRGIHEARKAVGESFEIKRYQPE